MSRIDLQALGPVAQTLVIPLYFRALESRRPDALIRDAKAVELMQHVEYDMSKIKLQEYDQVGIVMRQREVDRMAQDFMTRHPDARVVHIGCGLDTRFHRIDNGRVEWYDLDLPSVIALRREILPEATRYHLIAGSVFDEDWLDNVKGHAGRPFLFVAEGVLSYFPEAQVRDLVLRLKASFPGAELVCDAMTPFLVWAHNFELAHSRMSARLQWGLKHGKDMEVWARGIRLLEEWFYFDRPEPRLGAARLMRFIPPLARASGIFHYRLGEGGDKSR